MTETKSYPIPENVLNSDIPHHVFYKIENGECIFDYVPFKEKCEQYNVPYRRDGWIWGMWIPDRNKRIKSQNTQRHIWNINKATASMHVLSTQNVNSDWSCNTATYIEGEKP